MGGPRGTLEERFWQHVIVAKDPDACWGWRGSLNRGYPQIAAVSGKMTKAHLVSYGIHKGAIPAGQEVRITCGNKACTNYRHLMAGTHADTMRAVKQRQEFNRGEKNGRAKLTWELVRQMRRYYEQYHPSFWRLAIEFGVGTMTAWKVIRNRTWREDEATKALPTGGCGKS